MRCVPEHAFTVGRAIAWRSAIDDDPPYQRPADRWTLVQRQRFIDSILNGFDVPKLYFHDLRGIRRTKVYAVVDGKQRLHALWDFVADRFPLADGFAIAGVPHPRARHAPQPSGGTHWSDFDPEWRAAFLGTFLAVVLIQDAREGDIAELFFRLNDGVPLSAPERDAAARRLRPRDAVADEAPGTAA